MSLLLKVPEGWDELPMETLGKIALCGKRGIAYDLFVLYCFTGVKWFHFKKRRLLKRALKVFALRDFKDFYSWFYKENTRTVFDKVVIKGEKYNSPKPKLFDLTAEEFAKADDLYINFSNTKDFAILPVLAGVLYSPEGVQRRTFDSALLFEYAKPFEKLPPELLMGIFFCYEGCRGHLVRRFKRVFPSTTLRDRPSATFDFAQGPPLRDHPSTPLRDRPSTAFDSAQGPEGTTAKAPPIKIKKGYGFDKVILQMCQGDLSKHKALRETRLYTFLEQLNSDLKK
jgi:hypothetical protein